MGDGTSDGIWTAANRMGFIVHPPPDSGDDEHLDFARINPADDIPSF